MLLRWWWWSSSNICLCEHGIWNRTRFSTTYYIVADTPLTHLSTPISILEFVIWRYILFGWLPTERMKMQRSKVQSAPRNKYKTRREIPLSNFVLACSNSWGMWESSDNDIADCSWIVIQIFLDLSDRQNQNYDEKRTNTTTIRESQINFTICNTATKCYTR